jgi:uroporphyrinogen decarboxylase
MNKRERIRATLKGETTDRPPVSFWRHFYEKEDSAANFAEAMLDFQGRFDWDFMKVNPRATYYGEGWGLKVRFRGDLGLKPERIDFPIKASPDWGTIKALSPEAGALGEQLEALVRIRQGLGPEVPIVQTIFTPLSIAGDLVDSSDQLLRDLKENKEIVHHALGAIAATFALYARACLQAGADGIFLATTEWASRDLLTYGQYLEFGLPYDLQVLNGAAEGKFNILHVCGRNNMLKGLLDYPVHAFNWTATDPTNPSLGEILRLSRKAVIGGIDEEGTLRHGSWEDLKQEMEKAKEQSNGKGWMLGPGCATPVDVPEAHLRMVREEVERW